MKRVLNMMILAGVILFAYSCAETKDPTTMEMLPGKWEVAQYYVGGQKVGSTAVFQKFILERNNKFLLEDENSLVFVGDWSATDTELKLTATDGTEFVFIIEIAQYNKMQLVQKIKNVDTDLEIRYLLNKTNRGLDNY